MHTLRSYTLAQMEKGLTESFTVTVTEKMMEQFCAVSGDISPIHMDADYAASRGFPGRVVYGMLVASFVSTLAGVYLPGEHCLLHSVETKFSLPVFPGDVLTVAGKISEINETFKTVFVKGTITNQDGKKVCKANIQLGVRE